jgi:hypothetical protein
MNTSVQQQQNQINTVDPPFDQVPETTTSVQYILSVFYFLMGLFIIIAAAALPGLSNTAIATFVLLGFLVLVAGLTHILSVPTLACVPPQ